MIDPELYLKSAGLSRPHAGGQELILHEVLALLAPYHTIWLPFPDGCVTLSEKLTEQGHASADVVFDALYFGTPTIVDGRPLFPSTAHGILDKETERAVVRSLVEQAEFVGARRIVSGLGSGDISVGERIEDMGGGTVVVEKKFDVFTDWVIVRDLP